MKTVFLVALLFGLAVANLSVKDQFLAFQRQYNKVYATPEEFQMRYNIFGANLERAAAFQKKEKAHGARFGVTQFMDIDPVEFARTHRMPNVNFTRDYVAPPAKDFSKPAKPWPGVPAPDPTNYDWFASSGCCTQVYNQEQCGSCWAFSATETIESYSCLASGFIYPLAVQQIVDCDTAGQDQGCNGGFPTGAYQYVQSAGGQEYCDAYPYTGQTDSCQYNQASDISSVSNTGTSISGETGLYQQMSTQSGGPVSVCVDASSWQYYQGGVLTSCTNNVDHCVQATGYANYGQSGAYWIVRNSWGTGWGENGFIWVEIGQDLCAIGDYATVVSGQFTTKPGSDACSSQTQPTF